MPVGLYPRYKLFQAILSRLMPIKDQLRSPTCLTAAAGTGFGRDYIIQIPQSEIGIR